MAALILEFSTGLRHEVHYHRVSTFPFNIGRAYDNDLILSDDTVSAHHIRLDRDDENQITIQNLSTENGTWQGATPLSESLIVLNTPAVFTLGRTHLRIVSPDDAVAPTRHFPHASWFTRWASDLRVALVLLAAYWLMSFYVAVVEQSQWFSIDEVFINNVLEVLLPLLLATGIGFVSRLLLHRWRFSLQLSIACIALSVFSFTDNVFSYISYWFTNYEITSNLSTVFLVVCFATLLAWQLRAISNLPRRGAAFIGIAIVVPLFVVLEMQESINAPSFNPNPTMHTVLKASDIRIANNYESIETFRNDIEQQLAQDMAEQLESN